MDQDSPRQVRTGVRIELELIDERGHAEPLSLVIVREASADIDEGLIATSTPLARAILGKSAGSTVAYRQGDVHAIRILAVGDAPVDVAGDAAERRQAAVQQAVADAARTNAEIFAASYTSKWGGYDAGGVEWEAKQEEDDGKT